MRHRCSRDGCYLSQLPSWDAYIECLPRKIRPTDVDGMVEINGRFLFMEEKQAGKGPEVGQRTALRRLADLPGVTVIFFRPGANSDLEVLIYDGTEPLGFRPCSRNQFRAWLTKWARDADLADTG